MALRPYEEFDVDPLVFPYKEAEYVCPPLSITAGLKLAEMQRDSESEAAQQGPVELWKMLLGPLWDRLIEDDVPEQFATRCGLTALADYQYGRNVAEATWEAGVDPKALAELVIQRAAQANRATRRSQSTGGATKTPSRARSKATTSPSS
ncbi:DUF7426 family protein [Subtercola vilae]|uniref:DUF7426 domain-containing protein n=1 Tax=Subtercola vilae TaxID=2056433 RepID=A0A4T2BQE8_9MICO|nr:hypothetical protein [Subtercola vilae]TIH33677.1 hypothetical protein D4765_14435 [Subtercola vilae]